MQFNEKFPDGFYPGRSSGGRKMNNFVVIRMGTSMNGLPGRYYKQEDWLFPYFQHCALCIMFKGSII